LTILRSEIQKAPAADPCIAQLQADALTTFRNQYTAESNSVNAIAAALNTLRPSAGGRGGRGGTGGGSSLTNEQITQLTALAKEDNAAKLTARLTALGTGLSAQGQGRGGTGGTRGPTSGVSSGAGVFISEGDSPSYMHQIDVGLRSLENPTYGGWGGRFEKTPTAANDHWNNVSDDGNMSKPIWRWAEAFQYDWAARAMWCVATRYEQANHPPVVRLSGNNDIQAAPGTNIKLDASGSSDPDAGQQLKYSWWQYPEPGTYKGKVEIDNSNQAVATMKVPSDAKVGDTIHVIAEVTDTGQIPLTRYTRVIITAE